MILPGIQALFGFQLIAVFSPGFGQKLSLAQQRLHVVAIGLVVLGIALVMAPAALHRQDPREVTATFIRVSTRLLLSSMAPLAASICLECYLVGAVVVGARAGAIMAAAFFAGFIGLWFVLPRMRRLLLLLAS